MSGHTIDAEFEDVPDTAAPGDPAFGRRTVARPAGSAVQALADLLELGGEVATAGASVARPLAPNAADRAERVGEAARASADVVRSGVAAVEHIQAETARVAGPLAQKIRAWDEKARAAGLYGQRAAPKGVFRGPPRPVGATSSTSAKEDAK